MGDLNELIKGRRSVRAYQNRPVSREILHQLLEAMQWAPSGGNLQPWAFSVVQENRPLAEQIAQLSKYRDWMVDAPVYVVISLDHQKMSEKIFRCEMKHHQAVGSAIQNLMLAAHSHGLGTCWIGEILQREAELKELLQLPEQLEPMALLTVGYPDGEPKQKGRRPLDDLIVSWD